MASPEHVLVWLKPDYLGDTVMALPLLDVLAGRYDRPHVRAGETVQRLLDDRRERLSFVNGGSPRRLREFFRCVRQTREQRYQTVFLVNRSVRSALVSRLAGIPRRVGHDAEHRGPLLTDRVAYSEEAPETESFLDLARAVGVEAQWCTPRLAVSDQERLEGALDPGGPWVGIQPDTRAPWKRLPLECLVEVAKALISSGCRIVLVGGKDEVFQGEQCASLIGESTLNLVGRCELRKTMGVLTHLRLLVGGDTGLMHVAAAVGCPTITVFGKVSASKWGHHYAPHVVLQAPEREMQRVEPDMVGEACMRVLERP